MLESAIYVYGFSGPAIAPDLQIPGYEEIGPARIFEDGDVGVIASSVPPGSIEAGLSAEPPDAGWIVPRALHHERVLQAVMERAQVLPVRFGCVFTTAADLSDVLGRHRDAIRGFLDRMADHEEWSIKASLDEAEAVAFLLQGDPALAARFRALPESPGARYFLEKKLREEARRRAVDAGKAAAARLQQVVVSRAEGVKVLPVRAGEEGGQRVLLRLAVLLDRSGPEPMLRAVDEDAELKAAVPLRVEPTGPWPVYHFCPNLGEPAR